MGRDRRPPSSRSPWEGIGRDDPLRARERDISKFASDAATATNAAASRPNDWANKSARDIMSDMEKMLIEMTTPRFSGEFTFHIDGRDLPVRGVRVVGDGASGRSDPARARLEAEEARLRGPVEKYLLKTTPGVAWEDVVGNDTARAHLIEAIEHPVRHADLYRHYGKRPTKGVLLYGPPGCGKTMFGKAAASVLAELHGAKTAAFLSIKAPELQSMWVGGTEERIRQIFAYARAYKALHGHPLTVFIDEADAILPSRDGRATWFQESNVATFLTEMDGIEDSGALLILATNRPEAIDAAILRDGRIDRKVKVERPDRKAATGILQRVLQGVPLASEVRSTGELALHVACAVFATDAIVTPLATDKGPAFVRLSDIVNGAMLVGLVEQAKGNAFRRDLAAGGTPTGLTREDLLLAVEAVVAQNRGLNHAYAVQEIAVREGFTVAQVTARIATAPRYALDEADAVVRIQ